jgi:hypothetical protein
VVRSVVVFLDEERRTAGWGNTSDAGSIRSSPGGVGGRRRRSSDAVAVVQRGGFGVLGACTCFGLACRGFPCEVAVVLVTGGFVDNGDGYGLKRVKK